MKFKELDNSTKIVLQLSLAVIALIFLWYIRDILVIIILSLILASALDPFVGYMREKHIPRIISVLMVYFVVLVLAGLVVYLIIPPLVSEIKYLQANLPAYQTLIHERLAFLIPADFDVSNYFTGFFTGISGQDGVIARTFVLFNGFLSFIAVLVISIYLVAEEKGMKRFVESLVPEHHHNFTLNLIEKIQKKMGMWVLGQVIICFSIFLFTFIGLLILKIKYALFLALLAGLFELVPYIGPFLSAIPAVFFAFIQSPSLVIAVIILYLLIHEIEGYVLVPKIMEKTVGTSPLLVLVALLIGLKLAGVVGVLVAVPMSTAISILIKEFTAGRRATG